MMIFKIEKLVEILIAAGLEPRMVKAVLDKPELGAMMVQTLKNELGSDFLNKSFQFASPLEQIARVRRANDERWNCFTSDQFANLGPPPESSSLGGRNNLITAVLEVVLPNAGSEADIDRTVDELWRLAAAEQKQSSRYSWRGQIPHGYHTCHEPDGRTYGWDPIGGGRYYMLPHGQKGPLRLAQGIKIPKPGLRWRKVNLGANWNKERGKGIDPKAVRNPKSPHVAILAAAWLHPQWIRAMESQVIPCVRIPGFESFDFSNGQWCGTPSLIYGLDRKTSLEFHLDSSNYSLSVYAIPEFVK